MAGFVSAWVVAAVFKSVPDLTNISTGTAVLMSFLSIVAVAGIAGVLPPLLMYGKLGKGVGAP
jgi:heme A synthase